MPVWGGARCPDCRRVGWYGGAVQVEDAGNGRVRLARRTVEAVCRWCDHRGEVVTTVAVIYEDGRTGKVRLNEPRAD